ncbi:ATPase family AAA domain-containing protein 2-like [Ornithodoros turicata]|uniref:ATPase family AAA domain-containing protein 2-like n=1 Tax=Ornithodoros turicata TaxID=34597 RepID=UPI003138C966
MVKTRNQSSVDDRLKVGVKRATANSAKHAPIETRHSEDSDSEDETYVSRGDRTTRTTPNRKPPVNVVPSGGTRSHMRGLTNGQHDFSSDDEVNGDDDSVVRRSTRRRKCIYGNLNQSWILTSNVPEFAKANIKRSSRSKKESSVELEPERPTRRLRGHVAPSVPVGNDSETQDGDNEDSMESKQSQDKANSVELRRLGLPELGHGALDDDMYSRVKRTRQQRASAPAEESNEPRFFRTRRAAALEGIKSAQEDGNVSSEGATETADTEDDGGLGAINGTQGYHLRPKRPVTNRFQFPVEATKRSKRIASIFHTPQHSRPSHSFRSPAHRSPIYHRKRHAAHNSSSTSSSSDDDRRFERRKARSMARARNRCLPMNFQEEDLLKGVLRDRAKSGTSLADVDPMQIDKDVMFDRVGGLDEHIRQLKEMILFPLIYPEVFEKFKISPPRGVLFYGPPGTGKTLVARALANECSTSDRRVAFFMRKGADCLSKWVGESERQLRLLFDQAYSMRPSIIFFDEIDGLAPVRSTRQDQIHSSIVSTLLALMDGLDSRGEVVVIGATNRVDAIDPALRRPGRFDREFHFALPCYEARLSILQIHTREWNPAPSERLLSELAARCTGYCGADLKALCSEAALVALRRSFPQIYESKLKLQLDINLVQIRPEDYERAIQKICPASQRSAASPAHPLTTVIRPLLCAVLETALDHLKAAFATGLRKSLIASAQEGDTTDDNVSFFSGDEVIDTDEEMQLEHGLPSKTIPSMRPRFAGGRASHRPRLMVCGRSGMGQTTHVAPAVLHLLEHLPLHRLDMPALYGVTARAPEEACAQVLHEAQRVLPSVVYLPHLCRWWDTMGETVRATFLTLLHDLEPGMPVFFLATSDVPFTDLPAEVQQLFGIREVLELRAPGVAERRAFFTALLLRGAERRPRPRSQVRGEHPPLPAAPPPEPRKLTETELERLRQQEEATLRELRLFLRDILAKLMRDRRYTMFCKPVDAAEVPDYREVIREPMDLETMRSKIDLHQYQTVAEFQKDIDLICSNALEYNPDRDPVDKNIRHRACALRDAAYALVDTELDWEFEKICQDILQARKDRGEDFSQYAPKHYHVLPRLPAEHCNEAGQPSETPASDDGHPKRFSRRIRGLEVAPSAEKAAESRQDKGASSAENNASEPQKSQVQSGETTDGDRTQERYVMLRRRKSPWFGCRAKRIVRVPVTNMQHGPKRQDASSADEASRGHGKRMRLESVTTEEEKSPHKKDAEMSGSEGTVVSARNLSPTASLASSHSQNQGPSWTTETELKDCADKQQTTVQASAMTKDGDGASTEIVGDACRTAKSTETTGNEDVQELRLDRARLKTILETAVRVTEGCSIEVLERLRSTLLNIIQVHRRAWDRTPMLEELEQEVQRFQGLH